MEMNTTPQQPTCCRCSEPITRPELTGPAYCSAKCRAGAQRWTMKEWERS